MGLFIRSSICMMQCTKRMLCTAPAQNTVSQIFKGRKTFHVKTMASMDLFINKKLQNNETLEDAQWATVREELINLNNGKENVVDSQIYDLCFHYERFDQAIGYFKFLESNHFELNLNTIATHLRIYFIRKTQISPEEDKEICRIYDKLREKYPLLDGQTCSNCILALSLTKRWKDTLELMEMIKVADTPGVTVVGAIICAAFRNNEPKLAWTLINESITKSPLSPHVYSEYLNYCRRNFNGHQLIKEIERMLIFWREHQVEPKEYVVKEYTAVFDSLDHFTSYTSVTKRGFCSNCHKHLNQIELSLSDFKTLSVAVLNKVIIGENVFCSTSPQELKRYMLFTKTMQPYNVVIDGLNVAYGLRNKGGRGSLDSVLGVVDYFLKSNQKRILVIGRAHMTWWAKDTMKILKEKADVFLTKNISEDDPFLLHVTLLSGPQTYFVSKDLMRQHKNKLVDTSLQKLFKQWQMSRQYMFAKDQSGHMKLLPPLRFDSTVQKDEDGWHIPYTYHEGLSDPDMYEHSRYWACIRRRKETMKQVA